MKNKWRFLWGNQTAWCVLLIMTALLTSFVHLMRLQEGGEVTFLSMLFVCLVGYYCGTAAGVISALVFAVLKFALDYLFGIFSPDIFVPELWDYLLGYTLLGVCGFCCSQGWGFSCSYVMAVLFRYVESVWNFVYFYSEPGLTPLQNLHEGMIYSGGYIGAELILTLALLLIPQVREAMEFLKEVANHPYSEQYDYF